MYVSLSEWEREGKVSGNRCDKKREHLREREGERERKDERGKERENLIQGTE